MSSLNVNSLNQSTAFNVDINALNAYNQNNRLTGTGISVSSLDSIIGNSASVEISSGILKPTNNEDDSISPYYKEYAEEFEDLSLNLFEEYKESTDLADSDILEQMASKYADLRNDILENYSGDEAEEKLTQLNQAYEDSVEKRISSIFDTPLNYIAGGSSIYGYMYNNCKGYSFMSMYSGVSFGIEYDKETVTKAYNSENTLQLARKAVQYILDGNSAPVTDEEKEAFNEYISDGTDGTIGNLSYDDLKYAASTANSLIKINLGGSVISSSEFAFLYDSINSTAASDELKTFFNSIISSVRLYDSDILENGDTEEKIQELLEQRELMKLEMQKAQADSAISGEEKYSMYIKSAKQNAAIDTSLDEIINEIINYYNDEQ